MLINVQTELRWVRDELGDVLQERTATTVIDIPRPNKTTYTAWRAVSVVNRAESTDDECRRE